uniref:PH domain-containing protein n=1 Tax=Schistocephalus solidus TaxID=70667 RepID=A0A183TIC6_SCHSO
LQNVTILRGGSKEFWFVLNTETLTWYKDEETMLVPDDVLQTIENLAGSEDPVGHLIIDFGAAGEGAVQSGVVAGAGEDDHAPLHVPFCCCVESAIVGKEMFVGGSCGYIGLDVHPPTIEESAILSLLCVGLAALPAGRSRGPAEADYVGPQKCELHRKRKLCATTCHLLIFPLHFSFQEKEKRYVLLLDGLRVRDIESSFFGKKHVFALCYPDGRNVYKDYKQVELSAESADMVEAWKASFLRAGVQPIKPQKQTPEEAMDNVLESDDPQLQRQVEIIQNLVESYMKIVHKTQRDLVPKLIMHMVVNEVCIFFLLFCSLAGN